MNLSDAQGAPSRVLRQSRRPKVLCEADIAEPIHLVCRRSGQQAYKRKFGRLHASVATRPGAKRRERGLRTPLVAMVCISISSTWFILNEAGRWLNWELLKRRQEFANRLCATGPVGVHQHPIPRRYLDLTPDPFEGVGPGRRISAHEAEQRAPPKPPWFQVLAALTTDLKGLEARSDEIPFIEEESAPELSYLRSSTSREIGSRSEGPASQECRRGIRAGSRLRHR